ncbi:MAG: efflux RND transporter periplasmic adaptor subunit [Pseudomonadota bacterium]
MRPIFVLLLAALLCVGCGEREPETAPLVEVFVAPVTVEPFRPQTTFNARIQSRSDVSVVAQVGGRLEAIHFREGDIVEAGTPLFDIDAAPFEAALSKAQADLARATATRQNAVKNFERGKELVGDGFISASEMDQLESATLEAAASVEAAQAAVQAAEVDLGFTSIVAAQAGRVGRSRPAVGDVVGPEYGELTTLIGENDMEVVFQLPETLVIGAIRNASRPGPEAVEVAVRFQDDSLYPEVGSLSYLSNRVDEATGTFEARARIDNTDGLLRPGMFVRAELRLRDPVDVLTIFQSAVQVDQQGAYVLAVADSMVTRANIETGSRIDERVVITRGLEEGQSVIIRGIQQVRAGQQVEALPFEPATGAQPQ